MSQTPLRLSIHDFSREARVWMITAGDHRIKVGRNRRAHAHSPYYIASHIVDTPTGSKIIYGYRDKTDHPEYGMLHAGSFASIAKVAAAVEAVTGESASWHLENIRYIYEHGQHSFFLERISRSQYNTPTPHPHAGSWKMTMLLHIPMQLRKVDIPSNQTVYFNTRQAALDATNEYLEAHDV